MSILEDYEELTFSDQDPEAMDGFLTLEQSTESPQQKIKNARSPSPGRIKKNSRKLADNASSPVSSEPLADRLGLQYQIYQNRKMFKLQEKELKERQECTFSPKTNLSGASPRGFDKFLQDQYSFLSKKQKNLEELRKVKNREEKSRQLELRNKLQISPGSMKIIKRKGYSPRDNLKHARIFASIKRNMQAKRLTNSARSPNI